MAAVYRALKRLASETFHPPLGGATTLDAYMARYGAALGQQSQESLRPLHVPGRDAVLDFSPLLRQPLPYQGECITAAVKHLCRDKAVLVSGECGTGKTLLLQLMAHYHAVRNNPKAIYAGLVMCPGQLPNKWEREIRETIPGVDVVQIRTWRDAVRLDGTKKFSRPTWHIIPRDRAKLGSGWKAAYIRIPGVDGVCCPNCGEQVIDEKTNAPMSLVKLQKNKLVCASCQGRNIYTPLWQHINRPRRWAPAAFIHKHLNGHFDYFVADEIHQLKGADTAQGNCLGKLAASCTYTLGGTGTLIGGKAEHLRPILWRMSPRSLLADGLEYKDYMPFNERYGRIETRVTEKESKGDDNKQSKGSKRQVSKNVVAGIMPTLFGRHLIDKTIFISLEDVAEGLPKYEEILVPVDMDAETAEAYRMIEDALRDAITPMVARGDRRLLGRMLSILMGYPDHPHGFGSVGYMDGDRYEHVVDCPNLDAQAIRPKEQAMLDMLAREKSEGRQAWNYCQMTTKRDCLERLSGLANAEGVKNKVLRSKSVKLEDREEWIARHGRTMDTAFSHPQLVETGLDLFDKKGGHNFCSLAFYQIGFNAFITKQASRRAYRLGQKQPCRVYFFYYRGTMQERAMTLMGKKLVAMMALEGKFSSEGLALMAGDDDAMQMELAKSFCAKVGDDLNAQATWQRVQAQQFGSMATTVAATLVQLDSRPVDGDRRFAVQPCLLPPAGHRGSASATSAANFPAPATRSKPKPLYRQRVLSAFD